MKAQKRRRQFYQVGKGKEIPEMDVSRYTECERHSLGAGNIVSKHEIWHLENSALHSPALFHFTSYFLNQLVLSVKFSMTSLGGTCFLILSFLLNGKSSISSLPLYLLRMSNIRLYKLKKKKWPWSLSSMWRTDSHLSLYEDTVPEWGNGFPH